MFQHCDFNVSVQSLQTEVNLPSEPLEEVQDENSLCLEQFMSEGLLKAIGERRRQQ